jgi:hypothetical protein
MDTIVIFFDTIRVSTSEHIPTIYIYITQMIEEIKKIKTDGK